MCVQPVGGRYPRDVAAVDSDMARGRRAQAGDSFGQFVLTVAVDTGDAENFAGPHRERDVVDGLKAAIALHLQVRDLQHGRAERRSRALDIEDHVTADHQARQFARVGGRRVQFGDDPAGAHHRHPVGHGHDLLELVGNQQDRLAARLQAAKKIEERPDFARRQHARRLVQDEDVGVAVEQLQDLDALLAAHGQTPDRLVRVDVEPEGSTELLKPAVCVLRSRPSPPPRPRMTFSTTVKGATSMKC